MQDNIDRSCCAKKEHDSTPSNIMTKNKPDLILWGSVLSLCLIIGGNEAFHAFVGIPPQWLHHFAHASFGILMTMWWGIAIGIVMIGVMSKIPREFFTNIMGHGDNFSGLLRAVFGGLVLDLCCHGILLVAAKLYERGVSLAQVITFLVASPWNSVSLTLILITLIGIKWTVLYVIGSLVIALCTGLVLQNLTKLGIFAPNPNAPSHPQNDVALSAQIKDIWSQAQFSKNGMIDIVRAGWRDGKMIIKWLLFGTLIAAALRTFVPAEIFSEWLGPTITGLLVTLLIAIIVEICSEGSAPVAAEIVTNAKAPGNGFTFLMAGVATDYTEIMAVREFTKSWMIALALPLITVPQVLLIGWLMNMASTAQ